MKKLIVGVLLIFCCGALKSQPKLGQPAPEISLPNLQDSIIRLSSFKGKVVLIDFWTSWCGPCRAANPGVVKLYNKYRSRGFEVVGVSLDNSKKNWIRAVRQDKLPYTQVIDLARLPSTAGEQYKIQRIPTTYLLDKNGKVAGVDLEAEQLEHMIERLL